MTGRLTRERMLDAIEAHVGAGLDAALEAGLTV